MDLNIKGKNAIVTGGGGGLGKAITEVLAGEGANIAITYRSKEEEILKFIEYIKEEYKVECIAVKANLDDIASIENIFSDVLKVFNEVDILVNNAGIWPTAYVKDMTTSEFEKTMRVNLEAPFILCQKMVNHLLDRGSKGKIINIVSQAAFHGSTTGHAHYAASKGGLVTFTVSLAREVARNGINVNAVAPGIMRTQMNEKELSDKEKENYYINRIPLGRISDAKEVAYTVAFLSSDKSDYITGSTLDVTGGMLMR